MQNQQQVKLFAFKLAEKQDQQPKPQQQWKVREGVSVAGCTGEDARWSSNLGVADAGIYC
jgi:hypothetical protein